MAFSRRSSRSSSLRRGLLLFLLCALGARPASAADLDPPSPDDSAYPQNLAPASQPDASYLESLLEEAQRFRLHENPYWHTLLHYKDGLFGLQSLVDDPKFFLAENGKHDPAAELAATLTAFFTPRADDEKPAVCRFVARFEWLKAQLHIDETRLPVSRCKAFDQLVDSIQPESVTLIFPTSHMNSPASMYGHTLLTIRSETGSDLLAHAINYAAVTTETFGPLYIVKGLFGSYKGYFSILPYYAKLQEYSDVNDRDIWEYALDLNANETRRLLMHIYEMQEIYADYYFFSENCSYDLLFLLDAARPSLHLTDQCAWWVIPLDTIREIKKSGLIREAFYRPSRSTKIKDLMSRLPEEGRQSALEISRGTIRAHDFLKRDLPLEEKIRVCDLASEYLQYIYAKKELPESVYIDRFLKTLNARSALGAPEEDVGRHIPAPPRPDEGHHSNRVSFGFGYDDDTPFQELRLRPAYHTLLDNDVGYKPGSQIVFTDFTLRYFSREQKLRLESVDLIDIVSIAPSDDFFKHTSWKLKTDFFRRTGDGGDDPLVYRLSPGFGKAGSNRLLGLSYFMIETEFNLGGALDPGYSLGAGASLGMVRRFNDTWRMTLQARDLFHVLGDRDQLRSATLGQNFQIHRDMSVSLEVSGIWNDHESKVEPVLRWNVFF